jgi:HAD superfamily hydrolase (TIGR01484 family)
MADGETVAVEAVWVRYVVLACDYDGTLASDGAVDKATLAALRRMRASGRRLILVTGRELGELLGVFPHLDLFSRVVAENGAVLYRPSSGEIQLLAEPPPDRFVMTLRARGVDRVAAGRVIVATWTPYEAAVRATIRDLGLDLQVILNKDAVMVLPTGIDKATGLSVALAEIGVAPRDTVGVGDAENDQAFLNLCGRAVAVANALQSVKDDADLVTAGARGAGVTELIDRLIATDLSSL